MYNDFEPRILVWHECHGPLYFRANTLAELQRAYLCVFRRLDAEGYYDGTNANVLNRLTKARAGDAESAKVLLQIYNNMCCKDAVVEEYVTLP
jgi:hypothetical protein